MSQCLFNEPWQGQCKETAITNGLCCKKHSEEKCQVCQEQATTRCQASRGLMCGVPLCHLCGAGEMCLYHAGSGPLAIIRTLLGAGPEATMFSTRETLIADSERMKELVKRLKVFKLQPTMEQFEEEVVRGVF